RGRGPVGALRQRTAVRGRSQFYDPAERIAAAHGGRVAGARRGTHQRYRLRLRLQRPVLLQPLFPPTLWAHANGGARTVNRNRVLLFPSQRTATSLRRQPPFTNGRKG